MKKKLYIALFIFLGVLAQFLAHALIEIWYIKLLLSRFEVFSLGFSFQQWLVIHNIFAFVMLALGIILGFHQGVYWWKRLYKEDIGELKEKYKKLPWKRS